MKTKHQERADRVIQVFNDSNLNQRQFSELIDVSQQLVSAVINYKKRPNETILFGIIDNIKHIDPIWLITGVGKYNNNNVLNSNESNSLESKIEKIVEKRFEKLSLELIKKFQILKSKSRNLTQIMYCEELNKQTQNWFPNLIKK